MSLPTPGKERTDPAPVNPSPGSPKLDVHLPPSLMDDTSILHAARGISPGGAGADGNTVSAAKSDFVLADNEADIPMRQLGPAAAAPREEGTGQAGMGDERAAIPMTASGEKVESAAAGKDGIRGMEGEGEGDNSFELVAHPDMSDPDLDAQACAHAGSDAQAKPKLRVKEQAMKGLRKLSGEGGRAEHEVGKRGVLGRQGSSGSKGRGSSRGPTEGLGREGEVEQKATPGSKPQVGGVKRLLQSGIFGGGPKTTPPPPSRGTFTSSATAKTPVTAKRVPLPASPKTANENSSSTTPATSSSPPAPASAADKMDVPAGADADADADGRAPRQHRMPSSPSKPSPKTDTSPSKRPATKSTADSAPASKPPTKTVPTAPGTATGSAGTKPRMSIFSSRPKPATTAPGLGSTAVGKSSVARSASMSSIKPPPSSNPSGPTTSLGQRRVSTLPPLTGPGPTARGSATTTTAAQARAQAQAQAVRRSSVAPTSTGVRQSVSAPGAPGAPGASGASGATGPGPTAGRGMTPSLSARSVGSVGSVRSRISRTMGPGAAGSTGNGVEAKGQMPPPAAPGGKSTLTVRGTGDRGRGSVAPMPPVSVPKPKVDNALLEKRVAELEDEVKRLRGEKAAAEERLGGEVVRLMGAKQELEARVVAGREQAAEDERDHEKGIEALHEAHEEEVERMRKEGEERATMAVAQMNESETARAALEKELVEVRAALDRTKEEVERVSKGGQMRDGQLADAQERAMAAEQASEHVRTQLNDSAHRLTELKTENRRLAAVAAEVAAQKTAYVELEARNAQLESGNAEIAHQLKMVQEARAVADEKALGLGQELDRLGQRLQEAETGSEEARASESRASAELAVAESTVRKLMAVIQANEGQTAVVKGELERVQNELEEEQHARVAEEVKRVNEQRALQAQLESQVKRNDELKQEVHVLQGKLGAAENEAAMARRESEAGGGSVETLRDEVEVQNKEVERLAKVLQDAERRADEAAEEAKRRDNAMEDFKRVHADMLSQTAEQEKRLNDTIKLQQATSGQALLRAKEREKELEQALTHQQEQATDRLKSMQLSLESSAEMLHEAQAEAASRSAALEQVQAELRATRQRVEDLGREKDEAVAAFRSAVGSEAEARATEAKAARAEERAEVALQRAQQAQQAAADEAERLRGENKKLEGDLKSLKGRLKGGAAEGDDVKRLRGEVQALRDELEGKEMALEMSRATFQATVDDLRGQLEAEASEGERRNEYKSGQQAGIAAAGRVEVVHPQKGGAAPPEGQVGGERDNEPDAERESGEDADETF